MRNLIVKSLSLILFFSFVIINLSSCKHIGYKDVVSVTYTVNGKTKTERSSANMLLGARETISESEYANADFKYQFEYIEPTIGDLLTPSAKTVTSIDGFTNSDKGKFVYYKYVAWGNKGPGCIIGRDFDYGFSKYEIISDICYNYIKVKVVDDDTIIIRNSKGETTYNVSSYSITYFD